MRRKPHAEYEKLMQEYIELYTKGMQQNGLGIALRAAQLAEKIFGKESAELAGAFCYVGLSYESKGDYDRAIDYHTKALAIDIKVLGEAHPNVAGSYTNLSIAYHLKGDYERANYYQKKALRDYY